jgi:MerR family transcriptional regulator, copper efflux regulator
VIEKPMTIGQLARRTGVPIKTLREYEQLGLLYTYGRTESNYRLFEEETLWCVELIRTLRSLGLTIKEIGELTTRHVAHPDEPVGPYLAHKLGGALGRIDARIAELAATRQHIREFQSMHTAALAGRSELAILASDPGRVVLLSGQRRHLRR